MRVDGDGLEQGELVGREGGNPISRLASGGRGERALDVVLSVYESERRRGGDGVRRACRVDDLNLYLTVLYGGATRYHLRRLFQSRAVRQTVDEARWMMTITNEVDKRLRCTH